MGQADLALVVIEQRSEAPPDTEVQSHARLGCVVLPHPLSFLFGDHLKRQFIVVAQENTPLAVLWDIWCTLQDLAHILRPALTDCHIDARHDWKMEPHLKFIAIAEVGTDILWPLIRLT